MSVLKDAYFYLAGPIDNATDDGVGWRRQLVAALKQYNVQARIIDPTDKPTHLKKEVGEEKQQQRALRAAGKFKELVKFVGEYRHHDLRFVDLSDLLIAYVDPDIHMCGTYDEIFTAERQKKPRLLIVKGGLTKCPFWLFDVFDLKDMFGSVEECAERLDDINQGRYPLDSRWVLLRQLRAIQ